MELFQGMGSFRCLDVSNYDPVTAPDAWAVMPDDSNAPIEDRHCGGDYSCPAGFQCFAAGRAKKKVSVLSVLNVISVLSVQHLACNVV